MEEFSPVWISTTEQLRSLDATFRRASLPAKLLGTFALPEGAPHLRGIVTPWMRVPLVMLAQGRLSVGGGRLTFLATPFRAPGWRVGGVQRDLRWEIDRGELTAVEPADFSSPVAKLFDLPFTRVRTARPGLLADFLVCVGGRFSMPRIRERSLRLRRALQGAVPGAAAPESLPPAT